MRLHFLIEGHNGRWEAFCLDFDLAVQGDSYQQVMSELRDIVLDYLNDAQQMDEEERVRFLKRRAPLSSWLRFIWVAITNSFANNKDGDHFSGISVQPEPHAA